MSELFDPAHGLIIVEARVWGPSRDIRLKLALDSASTMSIARIDMLALIGCDPRTTASSPLQLTTTSGVEMISRVTLAAIEALGQRRVNFPIIAHTLPVTAGVDGVLGLDFLRGRRLTVDFRKGRISLT